MNMNMSPVQVDTIISLLDAAQKSPGCHQKNSFLLKKLYLQSDFDQFFITFTSVIRGILTIDYKQKNIYVERMFDFIGLYCTILRKPKTAEGDSCIDDPLIDKFLHYLLKASLAASDNICFRSFQLLNKILNCLSDYEMTDDLFTSMQSVLIDRLLDANSAIKLQIIDVICRFQDPTNPKDPVIERFIMLLHDGVALIRQRCVENIVTRPDSIPGILDRTNDVNVIVRLAAFKRLSKCVKALKICSRREVLFAAEDVTQPKIVQCIYTEVLPVWWEAYDCDIVKLMFSIRLDGDETDINETSKLFDIVLNNFFFKGRSQNKLVAVLPLTEEKLIPYEQLSFEVVSYWRQVVTLFTKNQEFELYVETVVPDVAILCQYIKGYLSSQTEETYLLQQYIIQQLFLIIRTYDLSDSYSCRSVQKLVEYFLKNADLIDDTIEVIAGILQVIFPDCETQAQVAMKIISDLLYPLDVEEATERQLDNDCQLAKLKVKLRTLQNDLGEAIARTDFAKAAELKAEIQLVLAGIEEFGNEVVVPIQEKTKDVPTICKCLDIAWAVLRCYQKDDLTTTMQSMKTEFVTNLLIHEHEVVRFKALRSYALCCLYDKTTACTGIHVFALPIFAYQSGDECESRILITCISAISDLLRLYGSDLLPSPDRDQLSDSVNEEHVTIFTGGTSLSKLIQGLVDLMEDERQQELQRYETTVTTILDNWFCYLGFCTSVAPLAAWKKVVCLYEIQLRATEGLCKLIMDERISSPTVVSRLILKWCNPVIEDESEPRALQQFIGYVLEQVPHLSSSLDQLEGAVITTIETLARAPTTSPLSTVDINGTAKFLLALCRKTNQSAQLQSSLALTLCKKINQAPQDKTCSVFAKLLLTLDLAENDILQKMVPLLEEAREYTGKIVGSKLTKMLSTMNKKLAMNAECLSEISEESSAELSFETSGSEEVEVEEQG